MTISLKGNPETILQTLALIWGTGNVMDSNASGDQAESSAVL